MNRTLASRALLRVSACKTVKDLMNVRVRGFVSCRTRENESSDIVETMNDKLQPGARVLFSDDSILTLCYEDHWEETTLPYLKPHAEKSKLRELLSDFLRAMITWWSFRQLSHKMRHHLVPALMDNSSTKPRHEMQRIVSRHATAIDQVRQPDDAVGAAQSSEHAGGADTTQS